MSTLDNILQQNSEKYYSKNIKTQKIWKQIKAMKGGNLICKSIQVI